MPDWIRIVEDRVHSAGKVHDREILAEIAAQLEDLYASERKSGASHEEALRVAMDQAGDWEVFRTHLERPVRLWGIPVRLQSAWESWVSTRGRRSRWLADLLQDAVFALRVFRRRPAFSAIVILTLGLGIGSSTSIFSVVDGVLLKPLPFVRPGELVTLWQVMPSWRGSTNRGRLWNRVQFTIDDYLALEKGTHLFSSIGVFAGWGETTLTGRGTAQRLSVGLASASLFEVLEVRPRLGRFFEDGEDSLVAQTGAQVTILSHELWTRLFAEDRSVIGQSIRLDGTPFTVVGVLPRGFRLPSVIVSDVISGQSDDGLRDLWFPLGQPGGNLRSEGSSFEVIGRLRHGVSGAAVADEALALLPRDPQNPDRSIRVLDLQEAATGGVAMPLTVLLFASGILLIVASANVGALQIGETGQRIRELATRTALGAGRARIARQLLTENLLLGLLGSIVGILLAIGATHVLTTLAPPIPRLGEIGVSVRVLVFALSIGLTTGFLIGLAPLWIVGRVALRHFMSQRAGRPPRFARTLQSYAAVFQITLTTLLLVCSGLLVRSFLNLGAVQPGFDPENLAVVSITVPGSRERAQNFFSTGLQKLADLPMVKSASGSYGLPFPGGAPVNGIQKKSGSQLDVITARRRTVWYGFHETMGIPILAGRGLRADDNLESARVMVLSASLAARYWKTSPVGESVSFWGQDWTIVGVSGDVRHTHLSAQGEPTFYVPFAQLPRNNMSLVVRTRDHPAEAVGVIREALREIDPEVPVEQATTMNDLIDASTADDRYRLTLFLFFGALAAILGTVGLFGVTVRHVSSRSPEISLRVALGATTSQVLALVTRQGLVLAFVGVLSGLAASFWTTRYLQQFLYDVVPTDPGTLVAVSLLLLTACSVAIYVPARRVLKLDPARLLNTD